MKIVILIYQIIQEKFTYSELFMVIMIGYISMFKMVKKVQNSGLEMVAGLTRPLITWSSEFYFTRKQHIAFFVRKVKGELHP